VQCTSPISDLRCDIKCDPGEYLDLDIDLKETICVQCPDQSISTGSTIAYSHDNQFEDILKSSDLISGVIQEPNLLNPEGCTNWAYNKNTGLLESGSCATAANAIFVLDYSFYMGDSGAVEIIFNYDTKLLPANKRSGIIKFFLNFVSLYSESSNNSGFITKTFPIKKGYNSFEIFYQANNSQDCVGFKARIKSLSIINGTNGPYSCTYCQLNSFSNKDRTSCESCQSNHYINSDDQCIACPLNTTAYAGSHGIESCTQLPICNSTYAITHYSECVDDKITVYRTWSPIMHCQGGKLPANSTEPCEQCPYGTLNKVANSLRLRTPCQDGEYIY